MSTLDDRKRLIAETAAEYPDTYYGSLIHVTGSLDAAARLDLATDGDTYWPDMRLRPFAGNEELKRLYREAQAAHAALHSAILEILWAERDRRKAAGDA